MLKSDQECIMLCTDLEGIHMCVWGGASPLTTKVKKNWSFCLVIERIIRPISLIINGVDPCMMSEMVDKIRESEFLKVCHKDSL